MKTWQRIKENPSLKSKYLVREKVIDAIRSYFKGLGFHEVQTPILVPVPSSEPNLEVFATQLKTATGKQRTGYLIMSPEYSLKKLLTAGMGNVFEITRAFRNEEEVTGSHNPEFTMLEWYREKADYKIIMNDFERMFMQIVTTVNPETDPAKWEYRGDIYDLTLPWPRLTVAEAFLKYAGIDTETMLSREKMSALMMHRGYEISEETTWEQMFYQVFFNEIEPKLKESRRPTYIYDYPAAQASLSRRKTDDPRFAERFEIFLAGLELGNCFSELTDPAEQRQRFDEELILRRKLGKTEYGIDEDFMRALESGMPDAAGIAVGVDRLVMLVANAATIGETMFFPAAEMFDL